MDRLADGNDNGKVTIHPWVTYVLGSLLLAGSLLILVTSPNAEEELAKSPAMLQARAYFDRNPEVEISGRFARWLGSDYVQEKRAKHEARKQAGGVAVLSKRMQAKSQKRFDALQSEAFSSLENLPSWKFGVVNASSPFVNTFVHLASNDTAVALGISMLFFVIAAISLETAWGSILFGSFFFFLPFLSAFSYTSLYGEQGVPWAGPSTVVAALLGAYAVRSIQGFVVPAWLLIPAWVVGEYLFARDLPLDSFDMTPVTLHAIGIGFGAVVAGAIWVLDLEEKLGHGRQDTPDLVSNPVLDQALEERTHGNPEGAFELLDAELRATPGNHDVAIALWETSTGTERARRAVPALLGAIRDDLRKGRREEAIALWLAIRIEIEDTKADGNLLVRMGEAMLGEEQHEAAMDAFAASISGSKPLSSVLAMRVVRGARGLDPDLAGRAAAVALIDDQLGSSERAEMQAIVSAAAVSPLPEQPAPVAAAAPAPAAEAPDPFQDPHAIAEDAFAELGEGESLSGDEDETTWNQPGLVQDLSEELPDEDAGFDWSGLQDEAPEEEVQTTSPLEVDTSLDLESGDAVTESASKSPETTETTETLEPSVPPAAPPPPTPIPTPVPTPMEEAATESEPELVAMPRLLRARGGVPLSLDEESITVDVEGGGKTRLAYARIEGIAAGAVNGLADKPVLVIDIVLNWIDLPDEPLKVIRMRSDTFDPRSIVPEKASALEALRAMLDQLLTRSGGTPLPNRDGALGNPFSTHPDIESYDRAVLMTR